MPCPVTLAYSDPAIRVWDDNCNDRFDPGEHVQAILPNGRTIGVGWDHYSIHLNLEALGRPALDGFSLRTASSFLTALNQLQGKSLNGEDLKKDLEALDQAAKKIGGPIQEIYRSKIARFREQALAQAWSAARGGDLEGAVEAALPPLAGVQNLDAAGDTVLDDEQRRQILMTAYATDIAFILWEAKKSAQRGDVEHVARFGRKLSDLGKKMSGMNLDGQALQAKRRQAETAMARIQDFAGKMSAYFRDGTGDGEQIMRDYAR